MGASQEAFGTKKKKKKKKKEEKNGYCTASLVRPLLYGLSCTASLVRPLLPDWAEIWHINLLQPDLSFGPKNNQECPLRAHLVGVSFSPNVSNSALFICHSPSLWCSLIPHHIVLLFCFLAKKKKKKKKTASGYHFICSYSAMSSTTT